MNMKRAWLLVGLLFVGGCVHPLDRVYRIDGIDSSVALSRKQIDNYKDGTSTERVMIWADGQWYEIWNKKITK